MRTCYVLALLTLGVLGTVHARAQGAPASFDVFVVTGQSNAVGHGEAAHSPPITPGIAYQFGEAGLIPLLSDPVGNARSGSAWPAFANAFYEQTGRGVVFATAAVGGSTLVDEVQPSLSWGPGGHLFALADRRGSEALAAALAAGLQARPAGWLWCQGERDARAIDEDDIDPAAYEQALGGLLPRYAATPFGQTGAPLFVIGTGRHRDSDTDGFRAVRAAQAALGAPAVYAYGEAHTFPDRGLMTDNVHWNQEGLNEAGRHAAVAAATWSLASGPDERPQPWEALVFPNPVRVGQVTRVELRGGDLGPVQLDVFDGVGRHILTQRDEHAVPFTLLGLSAGFYLARVQAATFVEAVPFVVLR